MTGRLLEGIIETGKAQGLNDGGIFSIFRARDALH